METTTSPLDLAAPLNRRYRDESLAIRVVGAGGDGIVTAGALLARTAALSGLEVLSDTTFPSEIRGGLVASQVRMAPHPLCTEGDGVDVLVAFNADAYLAHRDVIRDDGILIYDIYDALSDVVTHSNRIISYPVPMAEIAQHSGQAVTRNLVALAALIELIGLSRSNLEGAVCEHFASKGPDTIAVNLRALEAGLSYAEQHLIKRDPVLAPVGASRDQTLLLTGNDAIGLGALAAGCRLYSSYPITPATSLGTWLARHLPLVGGRVHEAEDPIASLGVAIGASFAGTKAMTGTSGPGLDLMQEMIGFSAMAEVPVVVAVVQRGGPSAGLPTKHEQADLLSAVFGSHGDVPKIVLAAADVRDCFSLTVEAFNLAERYQTPVLLLTDASLARRMQTIPRPDLTSIPLIERDAAHTADAPYHRYAATDDGIAPMALPGSEGGAYVATGLEHDDTGRPTDAGDVHKVMMARRFAKLRGAEFEMVEREGPESTPVGLVSWGITQGAVREAVARFERLGMPIAALYPKMLWPPPVNALSRFAESVEQIVVVEANHQGHLAHLIGATTPIRPKRLTLTRGEPISVWDIFGKEDLTR
ncbi:MAG: 2-oxoacid:acceptor oxidoreductase subunit alpha [Nitrospirota bacterium]